MQSIPGQSKYTYMGGLWLTGTQIIKTLGDLMELLNLRGKSAASEENLGEILFTQFVVWIFKAWTKGYGTRGSA